VVRFFAQVTAASAIPNLFIAGAMKCGTTSLHNYLDQHPAISMSSVKEPDIFSGSDWRDRVSRYERLLDRDAAVRGESSTNYSKYPLFPDVPARIAEVAPQAKVVYLVRDPLSRCISQWVHNVAQGREHRSLDDAVRDFDDPQNSYVWSGRYATQLERYLEHFGLDQLLVLDQAQLLNDRQATVRQVFRFLGVDDGFASPAFDAEFNRGDGRRRLGSVGSRLRRSPAGALYRRMPASVRSALGWARQRLLSPIDRPEFDDPMLKAELAALYDDELTRLAELTGERLARTSSA
jgi:sulfotransferase family protein